MSAFANQSGFTTAQFPNNNPGRCPPFTPPEAALGGEWKWSDEAGEWKFLENRNYGPMSRPFEWKVVNGGWQRCETDETVGPTTGSPGGTIFPKERGIFGSSQDGGFYGSLNSTKQSVGGAQVATVAPGMFAASGGMPGMTMSGYGTAGPGSAAGWGGSG
eukprot:Trichotokara_eunicae@DN6565_c0_g1_i1.p1